MDLEKAIIRSLKLQLCNSRFKAADLQEWSSDKSTVEKNIQPDKEIYIQCETTGLHCAVLKTADKRKASAA